MISCVQDLRKCREVPDRARTASVSFPRPSRTFNSKFLLDHGGASKAFFGFRSLRTLDITITVSSMTTATGMNFPMFCDVLTYVTKLQITTEIRARSQLRQSVSRYRLRSPFRPSSPFGALAMYHIDDVFIRVSADICEANRALSSWASMEFQGCQADRELT